MTEAPAVWHAWRYVGGQWILAPARPGIGHDPDPVAPTWTSSAAAQSWRRRQPDRHLVMIRRCPDPEQCPLCALGAGLCTGCRQGPPDDGYRTCASCRRKRRRRDRDRRHLAALDRAAEARRMTRTDLLRTLRSG